MRIGFFTDTYLPTRDGVVNSILITKKLLVGRGNAVYIFAPGSATRREKNTFYYKSITFSPYPGYRLAVYPTDIHKKLKALRVQCVHSHTPGPMGIRARLSAMKLNLPLIFTFHTLLADVNLLRSYAPGFLKILSPSIISRVIWGYIGWYTKRCNAIIMPSKTTKREFLANLSPNKIFVVPTGVNIRRFNATLDNTRIRKKLDLMDNPILLTVGRVSREKNLDVVIRAMEMLRKRVPKIKYIIVGKGPGLGYYKQLVRSKGLAGDVLFQGFVSDQELPYYYASADVFVFPSKFETQGMVAAEAMACGKPVAGAKARAIPEYVKEGYNGYLFEPDDPKGCASAILKCMSTSEELGKNARKTAEGYSTTKCIGKLLRVYENV